MKKNLSLLMALAMTASVAGCSEKKEEASTSESVTLTYCVAGNQQADEVEVENAINEMNSLHIIGKATTPFLLKRITELTGGESLASNIKLVFNNCLLASQIAKELSLLNK